MNRREFLAEASFSLVMPAIARGQASQVLTVIPQADLAVLDSVWTTTYHTGEHGFLVFDTLFGVDRDYKASRLRCAGAPPLPCRHPGLCAIRRDRNAPLSGRTCRSAPRRAAARSRRSGLGDAGAAPRKEGPGRSGRLEHLPHLVERHRPDEPGRSCLAARQREGRHLGWPSSPRLEALRGEWLQTPDLAGHAYQANLTGVLDGNPVFWNVRRG
jgi:hypothetical protein